MQQQTRQIQSLPACVITKGNIYDTFVTCNIDGVLWTTLLSKHCPINKNTFEDISIIDNDSFDWTLTINSFRYKFLSYMVVNSGSSWISFVLERSGVRSNYFKSLPTSDASLSRPLGRSQNQWKLVVLGVYSLTPVVNECLTCVWICCCGITCGGWICRGFVNVVYVLRGI